MRSKVMLNIYSYFVSLQRVIYKQCSGTFFRHSLSFKSVPSFSNIHFQQPQGNLIVTVCLSLVNSTPKKPYNVHVTIYLLSFPKLTFLLSTTLTSIRLLLAVFEPLILVFHFMM